MKEYDAPLQCQSTARHLQDIAVPKGRHPYYIVCPRYVRTSAGIKAMHFLCHALNISGQSAYMLIEPKFPGLLINPELVTPLLSPEIAKFHFSENITPIVVYPETISGNPFDAPLCVRFFGHFPGHLNGDCEIPRNDICFGFTRTLAERVGQPKNVLYIPVIDTTVFQPSETNTRRSGTCFYADKYKKVHKGSLLPQTTDSLEITRDERGSPGPAEIAEIFRRSELFYCYENTALALEAMLCGCPVVFLPNEHMTELTANEELQWDGYAWGDSPEEVERAKRTVGRAYHNHLRSIPAFWKQLEHFVSVTQARAAGEKYLSPMAPFLSNEDNGGSPHLRKQLLSIRLRALNMRLDFFKLKYLGHRAYHAALTFKKQATSRQ